jgi:CheY-like chemotaxis protein
MPHLPRPGQWVRWRDPRHAHAIRWLYAYGPGPFEVVGVVPRGDQGRPAGVVLKTDLGQKEVNEVWLTLDEPPTRSLSVLVVEDDSNAAHALCLLLAGWGHHPLAACDVAAAWETALAERPDVILLDIGLPGVDGWVLARRLRAEPGLDSVVVVAVTGYGTDADRQQSDAAGIDHHLVKPIEPERLQRLLAAFGAMPGPAGARREHRPLPEAEVSMPQAPLGKSVLVVEDDNAVREITVLLLQGQGYAVNSARNGWEALGLLHAYPPPDLIVLDLWMPGMNGWQFREHQQGDRALASIPVLVVSAVADAAEHAGALGEVDFLQKPVAPDDLFAAVARCVAGPPRGGS